MKRIKKAAILMSCVALLLAMTAVPAFAAASGGKLLSSVNWDNKCAADVSDFLNIRAEKSTDSEITGVLLAGRVATVKDKGSKWTKIKSGKYTGYVQTKYLEFGKKAADVYAEKSGVYGTVTANSLSIREGDSTSDKKLAILGKDQCIRVLSRTDNGWYKITAYGVTGYVSGDYLDINEPKGAISKAAYDKKYGEAAAEEPKKEKKAAKEEKKQEETTEAAPAAEEESSKEASGDYVISVTEKEIDMLAAIIKCEAGSESAEGKLAVGAVVVNRVQSSRYPDTVEKVIKQKGQFTPVSSGRFAKVLKKGAPKSCYEAAKKALQGETNVGNCKSFRAGQSSKGLQIGNQYFF